MVSDRDRTEPSVPRRGKEHLDRGRAVRGVVRVHVEVHEDLGASRDPLPDHLVPPLRVAAGAHPAIDPLELIDDLIPAPDRVAPPAGEVPAQPWLGDQPLELAREGDRVSGRKKQPALPVAGELLVDGELRGDGNRPRGEPRAHQPRGGSGAAGRHTDDVRGRDQLLGRRVARVQRCGPAPAAAARSGPRPAPGARSPPPSRGRAAGDEARARTAAAHPAPPRGRTRSWPGAHRPLRRSPPPHPRAIARRNRRRLPVSRARSSPGRTAPSAETSREC